MTTTRTLATLAASTFVLGGTALAQNDECTGAIALSAGSIAYDTTAATTSATAWPCAGGGGPDLWYSYTVPAMGVDGFNIETCGTSYDTALEIFTGTCAGLIPLDCNDDACGFQSQIQVINANPGEQFFIRVGGFSGDAGPGTLTVVELGPPIQGCVTNPGFESGTLAGWDLVDNSTPFIAAGTVGANVDPGFGFFFSEPTEGSFAFRTGWDGNAGETISIAQDITVAPGLTPLTFDYRAGWDLVTFGGGSLDREFSVVVRDAVGMVVQSTLVLTAMSQTQNFDTGPMTGSVDLSAFLGQTVNVAFEWTVPETFTGPSVFQLDNISCPNDPGNQIGTNYCMANPNSTGATGQISAAGTAVASANSFTLIASDLPPNQFGLFIASLSQGFSPNAGGTSNGNLCLGGQIGRINIVQNTGANGEFSLMLDLTAIPQGNGSVAVMAGDVWNFQAWHRDGVGQGSNFTNGLEVPFL